MERSASLSASPEPGRGVLRVGGVGQVADHDELFDPLYAK